MQENIERGPGIDNMLKESLEFIMISKKKIELIKKQNIDLTNSNVVNANHISSEIYEQEHKDAFKYSDVPSSEVVFETDILVVNRKKHGPGEVIGSKRKDILRPNLPVSSNTLPQSSTEEEVVEVVLNKNIPPQQQVMKTSQVAKLPQIFRKLSVDEFELPQPMLRTQQANLKPMKLNFQSQHQVPLIPQQASKMIQHPKTFMNIPAGRKVSIVTSKKWPKIMNEEEDIANKKAILPNKIKTNNKANLLTSLDQTFSLPNQNDEEADRIHSALGKASNDPFDDENTGYIKNIPTSSFVKTKQNKAAYSKNIQKTSKIIQEPMMYVNKTTSSKASKFAVSNMKLRPMLPVKISLPVSNAHRISVNNQSFNLMMNKAVTSPSNKTSLINTGNETARVVQAYQSNTTGNKHENQSSIHDIREETLGKHLSNIVDGSISVEAALKRLLNVPNVSIQIGGHSRTTEALLNNKKKKQKQQQKIELLEKIGFKKGDLSQPRSGRLTEMPHNKLVKNISHKSFMQSGRATNEKKPQQSFSKRKTVKQAETKSVSEILKESKEIKQNNLLNAKQISEGDNHKYKMQVDNNKHPARKHHRRDNTIAVASSIMTDIAEAEKNYHLSPYDYGFQKVDNTMIKTGETNVDADANPYDVAKSIAGFGVNDNRYGESWFEGQQKMIEPKPKYKNEENFASESEVSNGEDISDEKAEGHIAKLHPVELHGFEQDKEDDDTNVRDRPAHVKPTGEEMEKANEYIEGEQLKDMVQQKTSNIMSKICKKAECSNTEGANELDEDDKLGEYVHSGDEIIAQVSVGAENNNGNKYSQSGSGNGNKYAQSGPGNRNKYAQSGPGNGDKYAQSGPGKATDATLEQETADVISHRRIQEKIENVTAEEPTEVTADQRGMRKHCNCVSFVKVMKTPGCMDYCKALLEVQPVITKSTDVLTQMENRGHPLLYDKLSGDLIPQNPLLEAKTIPVESKKLSPAFIEKLQIDKSVLEHIKQDAQHDHGIKLSLKKHLKAMADSITKANIEKILQEPVGNVLAKYHHQKSTMPLELETHSSPSHISNSEDIPTLSHEGFTQSEDGEKHLTPIHIDENSSPSLVAQLLQHAHPSERQSTRIDLSSLNRLLHHSSPEMTVSSSNENLHPSLTSQSDENELHQLLHPDHQADENGDDNQEDDDDDEEVISKETLEKLLHHGHHGHHGHVKIVSDEDDDDGDEYVDDNDSDEHMMFADKGNDELHARDRHHLMDPESIHSSDHDHVVGINISALHLSPCRNGGVFVPIGKGKSQCICTHQFYGSTCEDWNFCYPNPCHNGGQCVLVSELPKYKCVCPRAYIGSTCQDFNPCDPNPCNNHGTCSHDGKTATCTCTARFKGENCAELNNCYPNPCQNGGQCADIYGKYNCHCKPGYIGKSCAEQSACFNNPCENRGMCVENGTSYSCLCEKGFVGKTCKDKVCSPNPCKNSGTCIQKENSAFACLCPPWASGDTCNDISPCRMNPCKNEGRCIDSMSGFRWTLKPMQYFCDCKPPYKGSHCQKNQCNNCHRKAHCEVDRCVCDRGYYGNGLMCRRVHPEPILHSCHLNPCKNDGHCVEKKDGQYQCSCKIPFLPPVCKERDPCQPNPCRPYGKCEARGKSMKCHCTEKFSGRYCNVLNPCKEKGICENNGVCIPTGNNTFVCSCVRRWRGERCRVCGCPASRYDNVPSSFCNKNGVCRCPEGYIFHEEKKGCILLQESAAVSGSAVCDKKPCANGAQCVEEKGTYRCICRTGTYGTRCHFREKCHPNPCMNGGLCLEMDGKFLGCTCPAGYKTPLCKKEEVPTKPCKPSPCQNGATCVPHSKGYDCFCPARFTGPYCTVDRCRNCDVNSVCKRGKCVCKDGYSGNGFECVLKGCSGKCLHFQTCIDNQCQCIPGHKQVYNICVPITDMSPGDQKGQGQDEVIAKKTVPPPLLHKSSPTASPSTKQPFKKQLPTVSLPATTQPTSTPVSTTTRPTVVATAVTVTHANSPSPHANVPTSTQLSTTTGPSASVVPVTVLPSTSSSTASASTEDLFSVTSPTTVSSTIKAAEKEHSLSNTSNAEALPKTSIELSTELSGTTPLTTYTTTGTTPKFTTKSTKKMSSIKESKALQKEESPSKYLSQHGVNLLTFNPALATQPIVESHPVSLNTSVNDHHLSTHNDSTVSDNDLNDDKIKILADYLRSHSSVKLNDVLDQIWNERKMIDTHEKERKMIDTHENENVTGTDVISTTTNLTGIDVIAKATVKVSPTMRESPAMKTTTNEKVKVKSKQISGYKTKTLSDYLTEHGNAKLNEVLEDIVKEKKKKEVTNKRHHKITKEARLAAKPILTVTYKSGNGQQGITEIKGVLKHLISQRTQAETTNMNTPADYMEQIIPSYDILSLSHSDDHEKKENRYQQAVESLVTHRLQGRKFDFSLPSKDSINDAMASVYKTKHSRKNLKKAKKGHSKRQTRKGKSAKEFQTVIWK